MKVRFGVNLGRSVPPAQVPAIVDRLEARGIDSLWFPELVYSSQLDPMVGMAHALGRTTSLKAGSGVAILPGRNPVLVAKQLASLAALAPKRVLPVFGLASANPAERDQFPVPEGRRGAVFDESLRLLRLLLTQPRVDFDGEFHCVRGASIGPLPDPPLDIWCGGSAPGALRRIGRLADGWLGSFQTPDESRRSRETIQAAADEAGREIEADHYGLSLIVASAGISPDLTAIAASRRPGVDPASLIADSWPALHRLLDGHLASGLTKFVVRPGGPEPYDEFLDRFVEELVPRQN